MMTLTPKENFMPRKRVLLIIESCNPEWASVPLVGYNFFSQISKLCDATLVTHERNQIALEKSNPNAKIVYIRPSKIEKLYYSLITRLSTINGSIIWPLRHTLQYPIYFFFDRSVDKIFHDTVANGEFDIVHAMTPILPRYPVKISKRCNKTPFILGPVNGGIPFPEAFKDRGKKEFSQLNFLRKLGALLIPNYQSTYRNSDLILAGSTYTKNWIESNLNIDNKVDLFFENGVTEDFYKDPQEKPSSSSDKPLKALFVGRLVPYKGVDMLVRSMQKTTNTQLTIVGDGPERAKLQGLVARLGLKEKIAFTGWIAQSETRGFYQQADIFCFPSVREFGGAVVMEAMAAGLPCLVVDNGGIGEYVTEECGYKIAPRSEQYVTERMSEILSLVENNPQELQKKASIAFERAKEFSWKKKGELLAQRYDLVRKKQRKSG